MQLNSVYCSSGSSDYVEITPANQPLKEFSIHRRQQCFNVTVTNDRAAEDSETFTVVLEKHSNKSFPQVQINPGVVTITISDDEQRKCILCWSGDTFNICSLYFSYIQACPAVIRSYASCFHNFLHTVLDPVHTQSGLSGNVSQTVL